MAAGCGRPLPEPVQTPSHRLSTFIPASDPNSYLPVFCEIHQLYIFCALLGDLTAEVYIFVVFLGFAHTEVMICATLKENTILKCQVEKMKSRRNDFISVLSTNRHFTLECINCHIEDYLKISYQELKWNEVTSPSNNKLGCHSPFR